MSTEDLVKERAKKMEEFYRLVEARHQLWLKKQEGLWDINQVKMRRVNIVLGVGVAGLMVCGIHFAYLRWQAERKIDFSR
jgi:hypothetical protein